MLKLMDLLLELSDADIKVGDAYKTTSTGLIIDFVYEKESRGGATTIEYQFKPRYGLPGFVSVGSGNADSVDGWGKHKKIKITSKMKKTMIKTVEDAIKITWMLLTLKAIEGLDIFVDPNLFEL